MAGLRSSSANRDKYEPEEGGGIDPSQDGLARHGPLNIFYLVLGPYVGQSPLRKAEENLLLGPMSPHQPDHIYQPSAPGMEGSQES